MLCSFSLFTGHCLLVQMMVPSDLRGIKEESIKSVGHCTTNDVRLRAILLGTGAELTSCCYHYDGIMDESL